MILGNIVSAVKKENSDTPNLQYIIFDIILDKEDNQTKRIDNLEQLATKLPHYHFKNILIITTEKVSNILEVERHCALAKQLGYEGSIFRNSKAKYQFGKRSNDMLKLKKYEDGEFKIIDVLLSDKQQPEYCVLLCVNDISSGTFKVAMEMNNERRAEIYNNKQDYIGKMATIKYYERTKNKLPFHAKCVEIRDYE